MGFNIDKKWIIAGIATIVVVAVVVAVIVCRKKKSEKGSAEESVEGFVSSQIPFNNSVNKERFTIALGAQSTQDAVGSVSGTIVGTTGTTRGDAEKALMQEGKFDYADGVEYAVSLPANVGEMSPLDNQLKLHAQTLEIAERNNGMPSHEDHKQIADNVQSGGMNSVNIFKRGMKKSLKMTLDPLGVQGVIDEKYLPERERNGDLRVVGTVIPIKGYDINVERMGESLKGMSWRKVQEEVQKGRKENGVMGSVKGGLNLNMDDMVADVAGGNEASEETVEVEDVIREGFTRGAMRMK